MESYMVSTLLESKSEFLANGKLNEKRVPPNIYPRHVGY